MPLFLYKYSTATTAPPTGTQVRFNAVAPAAVTEVWLRYTTDDGMDAFYPLLEVPAGVFLYVQDRNNHLQAVQFETVSAAEDRGDYCAIGVTWRADSGVALGNNQDVLVTTRAIAAGAPEPPEPAPVSSFVQTPWTSPAGIWRALVAGPIAEPLTLPEGKLRAGLDWPDGDPRDQLMRDFITAARAQVEKDTGLALLQQTWDVTFGEALLWPLVPLPAQTQPAQSIEPLAPAPARRIVTPRFAPGRRQVIEWPGVGTYRIVAGWPNAAALRQEAPGLYHAVALLTAHYATLGRDMVTVGETANQQEARLMPFGYEDAIGAYRLVWVT